MKTLVLAVALAFSSLLQAETVDMGDCKSDQSSKSEQGRSVDVSGGTWGIQALGASANSQMQDCVALLSKPITRPGRWSDDPFAEPNYYPDVSRASICHFAASKAIGELLSRIARNGVLPSPDNANAQLAVSKLPFAEYLTQALQLSFIRPQALVTYQNTSNISWSWDGSPWRFTTDNGVVASLRSGRPWFDADHVEGRKVSYKQSTSASSSSGFATSIGCMGKPY